MINTPCSQGRNSLTSALFFCVEEMAKPILDDEPWALIAPLLPPPKPRRAKYPGRKPLDDRALLTGILFVLQSGIPWEMLPQEMGCGSGVSC